MQASLERLRQRREERGEEGGFTLIELLIVIVILAILAAIVVFAVQNLTSTSAKSSCQTDYKTVESAAEAFKAQVGNYPNGAANDAATASAKGYFNGAIVNFTTDPSGYTSPGYSAGPPVVTGTNGVDYLLESAASPSGSDKVGTLSNQDVGPWLKDAPANGGHYEIALANDGTGKVSVWSSDGTHQVSPSGVIAAAGTNAASTNTVADCGGVG